MAAYRADIEIGVRGVRRLEELRSSINTTARAVDSLNEAVGARGGLVQSIENYTKNLNRAAQSLSKVGAGTQAETKAVREYVRALGEANTARQRQNYLIAQQVANQRKVQPGTAGTGQQTPALPPSLIGDQKVKQAWRTFFLEAAETATVISQNTRAARLNVSTSWSRFFNEAADVSKGFSAQRLNLKNSWNTFFRDAAQLATDLSAQVRQTEAALSAAARQRLAEQAATRGRISNAGFGVQGPALPPTGGGGGGTRGPGRLANVALGAGFPLLFGGGPGAVLGGAAGGLIPGPGAFAAQIAFSAIGQQFDKLAEQAGKVGRALNPLTFDLETFVGAAGIAGTATADFLAKVEQYAGKTEAAKEATKLLAARIGTDATNALKKFGEDAQKLGNQLSIIFTTVLANIARIVGPLIAGLAGAAERAALVGGFKQRQGLTGREAVAQQILGTTARGGRGKGGAGASVKALGQQIGLTGTTREIIEGAKNIATTSQKSYQAAQESALSFKATQLEAASEGAKGAKKLADELGKLGIKYTQLLQISTQDLKIAREADPIKKLRLQQDREIQKINGKYAEDLKKVAGTQVEKLVLEAKANEIALVRLNTEEKISEEYARQAAEYMKLFSIFSKFDPDLGGKVFRGGPGGAGTSIDTGAAFGAQDTLLPSTTKVAAEAQKARESLADLIEPANQIKQAASSIGGAFTDSFRNVITGSMSAQEALAGFFNRIADAFMDMAAQIITKMIVIKTLESAIGLFGGGGTQFKGSGPVAFPSGLDIGGFGGALGFRANGGSVKSGSPYMVGERGPELFVPGRSGTIVPNNKLGGGGSANVVVNVDATGSTVEGNSQQAKQLGDAIGVAVRQELIKQKRPGGLLG